MFSLLIIIGIMVASWHLLDCRYDKPFLWYTWEGERKYIRLF